MSLPPAFVNEQMAVIGQNKTPTIIGVCSVFGALAVCAVAVRLWARSYAKVAYASDDILAVVAVFFNTAQVVAVCLGKSHSPLPPTSGDQQHIQHRANRRCLVAHFGMGRHLLAVSENPSNLVNLGKSELAFSLCYPPSIAFAKLSIISLVQRIFGTKQHRKFRIISWTLFALVTMWLIALWLVVLLQCHPITGYWSLTDACQPLKATTITTGVLDAVLDVAIFILPQPLLWKLQMPRGRKALISGVFLIGLLATVFGIARIPLLFTENVGAASLDTTWNATTATIFTVLEPSLTIICMCLPMTFHVSAFARESSWYQSLKSKASSLSFSRSTHTSMHDSRNHSKNGTHIDTTNLHRNSELEHQSSDSFSKSDKTSMSLRNASVDPLDPVDRQYPLTDFGPGGRAHARDQDMV